MRFNKYLASGLELLIHSDLIVARPNMVCIAIPLYLDTEVARNAIWEAWESSRIRGTHYDQDAKYQIFKLDLKGRKTIVPVFVPVQAAPRNCAQCSRVSASVQWALHPTLLCICHHASFDFKQVCFALRVDLLFLILPPADSNF
jgi:hypothetical protein